MIKKAAILIVAILTYIGLEQAIERSTKGFWIGRIKATNLPYKDDFCTTPVSQEEFHSIEELLKQPFYLIGAGSECFAFMSQDQTCVLKLFKLDLWRPVYIRKAFLENDLKESIPSTAPEHPSFIQNLMHKLQGIRNYRINRTFRSISLAYNNLREETALLYVHLNPSMEFKEPLTLYDSCHIAHTIDLNTTRFVLQKTATPFVPYIQSLIKRGNKEEITTALSSLVDLVVHRCQHGIADRDVIARNFGFVEGKAVEIDTGSFSLSSKIKERWVYTQELLYLTAEITSWLKQQDPEIASLFAEIASKRTSQGVTCP